MKYGMFYNPFEDDIFDLIDFFQPIRLMKRPIIITVRTKDDPIYDENGVKRNPVAPPENELKQKTKPQQNVPEEKPEEKSKKEYAEDVANRIFDIAKKAKEEIIDKPDSAEKKYAEELSRHIINIAKKAKEEIIDKPDIAQAVEKEEEPKVYGSNRHVIHAIKRPTNHECMLWDGTDDTRGNIFVWSGFFAQVINNQLYLIPSKGMASQKILTANVGDYIVKDEDGIYSVVPEEEFHKNYDC